MFYRGRNPAGALTIAVDQACGMWQALLLLVARPGSGLPPWLENSTDTLCGISLSDLLTWIGSPMCKEERALRKGPTSWTRDVTSGTVRTAHHNNRPCHWLLFPPVAVGFG